jgi:hypothetical protein
MPSTRWTAAIRRSTGAGAERCGWRSCCGAWRSRTLSSACGVPPWVGTSSPSSVASSWATRWSPKPSPGGPLVTGGEIGAGSHGESGCSALRSHLVHRVSDRPTLRRRAERPGAPWSSCAGPPSPTGADSSQHQSRGAWQSGEAPRGATWHHSGSWARTSAFCGARSNLTLRPGSGRFSARHLAL